MPIICGSRSTARSARKVSDEFTVPLCRGHHREVHRSGDEAGWWKKTGIDPTVPARALWLETHPLPTASDKTGLEGATSLAAVGTGQRSGKRDRPIGKRGPKYQNKANYRGWAPMTSFRQIEANRRNACKSTGPITEEGKQRSRCNAVRHGLTAETVIGALEDAEDYKAFEAAIIADYDAQSAVERELVLRLASLLWRLRRATTMETGLFDIQADCLREFRQGRQTQPESQEIIYARLQQVESVDADPDRASQRHHKQPGSTVRLWARIRRSRHRPRTLLFASGQSAQLSARPA